MESHSDELDCRVARKTYLITYSRADKGQFTSKQLFAYAVVEVFSQGKSKAPFTRCRTSFYPYKFLYG